MHQLVLKWYHGVLIWATDTWKYHYWQLKHITYLGDTFQHARSYLNVFCTSKALLSTYIVLGLLLWSINVNTRVRISWPLLPLAFKYPFVSLFYVSESKHFVWLIRPLNLFKRASWIELLDISSSPGLRHQDGGDRAQLSGNGSAKSDCKKIFPRSVSESSLQLEQARRIFLNALNSLDKNVLIALLQPYYCCRVNGTTLRRWIEWWEVSKSYGSSQRLLARRW